MVKEEKRKVYFIKNKRLIHFTDLVQRINIMAGRKISKGHATGALTLGIIETVIGLIVTTISFVLASKAKMSPAVTPYWAGLIVSRYL